MSAPLDHVTRGYDRICEPGGKPHIVCRLWPECMCSEDCADVTDNRTAYRLLAGFVLAVLAIAGGLIFWGMHS